MRCLGRATAVALGVSLTLAVSGCGVGPSGDDPIDPEAPTKIAGLYTGSAAIRTAEEALVAECMQSRGFAYTPSVQLDDRTVPREYGDDVAAAERDGYGLRVMFERAEDVLDQEKVGNASSRSEKDKRIALFGQPKDLTTVTVAGWTVETPSTGCVADAQTTLYGSVSVAVSVDEMISNVIGMALASSQEQPAVRTAFEEWRSCMSARGYRGFKSRNGARGLAMMNYDSKPIAQAARAERAIAVDDAECDAEAGYTPVREQADIEVLSDFLAENEAVMIDLLEKQQAALRNARQALL